MGNNFLSFTILLLMCTGMDGLIIPEELPTILSLIYSNIPPIRKGTDSRLGVGFRLGHHADFQALVELGPQIETEKIGNADSKQRRQTMLHAAMRGDMGPWTKSVAEFNISKMKQKQGVNLKYTDEKKDVADNWLMKWSKEMSTFEGGGIPSGSSKIQRIRMNLNTKATNVYEE